MCKYVCIYIVTYIDVFVEYIYIYIYIFISSGLAEPSMLSRICRQNQRFSHLKYFHRDCQVLEQQEQRLQKGGSFLRFKLPAHDISRREIRLQE